MACRDPSKADTAANEIMEAWPPANIKVEKLDLASLKSIRAFSLRINRSEEKIDYLINNAGIMNHPKAESEDGFELHWATNYLGHFMLTMLLLEKLKSAPEARIINVSSIEHLFGGIKFDDINRELGYNSFAAYGQSKLALVLFTQELATRLKDSQVKVYSVHPGLTRTDIYKYLSGIFALGNALGLVWFKISPFLGTQTTLFCLMDESVEGESGSYYAYCKKGATAPNVKGNTELQAKLWELSCKSVGINNIPNGVEMVKTIKGNNQSNGHAIKSNVNDKILEEV